MSEENVQRRVDLSRPVPPAAPQPGDRDYVPPADIVPLPSLGKVYPPGHPLHLATSVELRPMAAKEEDILTNRALIKSGRVIGALIRSCMANKLVDPEEMLVGDRNALLISIRSSGYGTDYVVDVTCPECEEKTTGHVFDLSRLPLTNLKEEPLQPGMNAFPFSLPFSKKSVVFKLLTGAEERDLSNEVERTAKAGSEQAVTMRLIRQIVSVDGNSDEKYIADFVRLMSPRDSRPRRKHIAATIPGVDMTQKFLCQKCNTEREVEVPLGPEFFWPE